MPITLSIPSLARQPMVFIGVCGHCGKRFQANRESAKYCSDNCRKAASKARGRAACRAVHPTHQRRPQEVPVQTTSREYLEDADLEFFGLQADPFDDPMNPEDLFLPPAFVSAERAMTRAVQQHHILAVCGDPGAGKSTLLRRFISRAARESQVRVLNPATLDRSCINATTLAVAVLRDLANVNAASMSPEERSNALRRQLAEQGRAGYFPVLVIDEAHHLKQGALLAIKQLWDSASLCHQLAVFLLGHRSLAEALRGDPRLRELTGRTKIIEMSPLDSPVRGKFEPVNTAAYLKWRFSRVGADAMKVFTPAAIEMIAKRGEHPLWISNISVLAMRYAHHQAGDRIVDIEHVGKV